jgi:hypothetical protein
MIATAKRDACFGPIAVATRFSPIDFPQQLFLRLQTKR